MYSPGGQGWSPARNTQIASNGCGDAYTHCPLQAPAFSSIPLQARRAVPELGTAGTGFAKLAVQLPPLTLVVTWACESGELPLMLIVEQVLVTLLKSALAQLESSPLSDALQFSFVAGAQLHAEHSGLGHVGFANAV